ncbi:MAG: hypothetical protein HC945_00935 [Nitrosarchaeum sp.]|nr:hypothetical protein [Nitrosarchaeum sp.]
MAGGYPALAGSYITYALFFFGEPVEVIRWGNPALGVPGIVWIAALYLALFFGLFCALGVLLRDDALHIQNSVLGVINAVLGFGFGLALVMHWWHSARGVFAVLFAAVYLYLAYVAKRRNLVNMFEVFFVLCIASLAVAIFVQLRSVWIAIGWVLLGALLFHGGLRVRNLGLRILGYVLLGLGVLRSLLFDSYRLDFGERTLGFFVVLAGLAYVAKRVGSAGGELSSDEKVLSRVLFGADVLLAVIFVAIEIIDGRGFLGLLRVMVGRSCSLWRGRSWRLGLSLRDLCVSRQWRGIWVLGLFALTVLKLLVVDFAALATIYRTIVSIVVGLFALGVSFVYVRNKDKIDALLEEGKEEEKS